MSAAQKKEPSTWSPAALDEDDEDEEGWSDWEEEEEVPSVCLFCSSHFPSATAVFEHCQTTHEFDVWKLKKERGLDFYGCVRLVNFVREQVGKTHGAHGTHGAHEGTQTSTFASLLSSASQSSPWTFLEDDRYLKPVLENDGLLQFDFEGDLDEQLASPSPAAAAAAAAVDASKKDATPGESKGKAPAPAPAPGDSDDVPDLQDDDDSQSNAAVAAVAASLDPEYIALLQSLQGNAAAAVSALPPASQGPSKTTPGKDQTSESGSDSEGEGPNDQLDYYFASYSHHGIHEEMLKDVVRTQGYQDFMYKNKDLFKDKVVLDVGCGTGILCLFAARAGARKVIGIDRSRIIDQAMLNVKENGYENVITLIQGKVENVKLPVEKVDIIISEWMGYMLLFESMLDTVLFARDKWLAGYSNENTRLLAGKDAGVVASSTVIPTTGGVYPDKFAMYMVAMEDPDWKKERIDYWDDVYGFKMTAMKPTVMAEAVVDSIDADTIIAGPCLFKGFDMHTVKLEDLEFTSPLNLVFRRDGICHALVSYFDTSFEHACGEMVYFSTGPEATLTHWKQTIFYLNREMAVRAGDVLSGTIYLKRSRRNHRALEITLKFTLEPAKDSGDEGVERAPFVVEQFYTLD